MDTQKAMFGKLLPMSHHVTFDMSDHELTVRASNTTTQKATENNKSYQTKSLDQIRLEQELAQAKADLACSRNNIQNHLAHHHQVDGHGFHASH